MYIFYMYITALSLKLTKASITVSYKNAIYYLTV